MYISIGNNNNLLYLADEINPSVKCDRCTGKIGSNRLLNFKINDLTEYNYLPTYQDAFHDEHLNALGVTYSPHVHNKHMITNSVRDNSIHKFKCKYYNINENYKMCFTDEQTENIINFIYKNNIIMKFVNISLFKNLNTNPTLMYYGLFNMDYSD